MRVWKVLGWNLAVAALYVALGRLSFGLALVHGTVTSVVFLPEGVALGAACLGGPALAPGVFLGQLLLARGQGVPWPAALGLGLANAAEALLGGWLWRRSGARPDLGRVRDVMVLAALVVLVLQPFSATFGTGLLAAQGLIPAENLGRAWLYWWSGNFMGQLLVTSLLLSVSAMAPWPRRRIAEAGAFLAGFTLFALGAFGFLGPWELHHPIWAFSAFYPLLSWAAVRFGPPGAAAANLLATGLALAATASGRGPFAQGGLNDRLLYMNTYILGALVTSLLVAASVAERTGLLDRLRGLEEGLARSPLGMAFTDARGLVVHANPASLDFGGTAPGERDPAFGQDRGIDGRREEQQGSRWVSTSILALPSDEAREIRFLVLREDCTGERRLRRMKEEFLGLVSHELRTPVTAFKGAVVLLEEGHAGPMPPEAKELLALARRNAERLARIVDDLLDLQKLEGGHTALQPQSLELARFLRLVMEAHGPAARRRGLVLRFEDGLPDARAWADPLRLDQILSNFLGEAFRQGSGGREVLLRTEPSGGRVRISVADGSGSRGGAGLGLTVTRALAEAMGGQVGLRSEEGRGSTYWVEVPLSSRPSPASPGAGSSPGSPTGP